MATHTLVEGDEVFARVPHGYNKVYRDRGEVFKLIDARNNATLEVNKYFLAYNPKEHNEVKCDVCGRRFINDTYLRAHRRKPDCFADSQQPTRVEYAELVGKDPDKFKIQDEPAGEQHVQDLNNEV